METETLSNYEQKHLDNTMDVDIPQEDESASPVNKTYEENTESTDVQNQAEKEDKENEVEKPGIEIESEEECEEEEEEKLLLSPAHSDKAYDSDDDPLSPPLNRDLEESDNEGDKEEKAESNEKDKEEVSETSKEEKEQVLETEEEKDEIVGIDEEEKINSENLQNNLDDKNSKDDEDNTKDNNRDKDEENIVEEESMVESQEDKKSDKPGENIQTVDSKDSGDKDPLDNENDDKKQDKDKDIDTNNDKFSNKDEHSEVKDPLENENINKKQDQDKEVDTSNDKVPNKDEQLNSEESKEETPNDKKLENKIDTEDNKEETTDLPSKDDTNKKEGNDGVEKNDHSLLKESLIKPFDDGKEPEADEEMDMYDDFDPSLLCPELSMEVDEAPVITTNDAPAPEIDGSKSPLRLYDPIFSTFVDEMTGAEVDFNLTAEELELKAKTYGPKNPIQFTKIHCTACNVHLGSALDGQGNRFVHPLLKVLICKKCYHFYTSGEFEKDEDGSELYCRWCGQGGQVMCCSNCEMVFCKKCIRINFDRKKLSDIQKSDEWMCFRCNPSQLIHLRIHCAEFMEYVQIELRRASSSGNVDAFMNTDYCQCCIPQKKKAPDATTPVQPKKRKRHTGEEDPDYDPTKEREEVPPPVVTPTPSTSQQVITPKMPTFSPRVTPSPVQIRPNLMRPGLASQNRPRMPIMTPPGPRPQQGFLKVMPGGVRLPGPSVSNAAAAARPGLLRPIRPSNTMKHEWFEKTVRAAARVNSNLSYTLTQLNRAQANATSVEGLAVVHNKLQEILSSSINSLIQIRKNLRTEFIAGIKNLRFPPKPTSAPPQPSTSKDDDDVIFVPSDPSPPCPPLVPVSNNNTTNKINLPSSISLVKKSQPSTTVSPPKAIPSTSGITIKSPGSGSIAKKSTSAPPLDDNNRPKGFLRVKSFSALQSVPSECITIPDDPPEEEPKLVEETDPLDVSKDPLDVSDVVKEDIVNEKDDKTVESHTNGITNGEKGEDESSNKDGETPPKVEDENSKKHVDVPLKVDGVGMLKPATIVLHRSQEIDDMVKTKFDVVNGDVTD